MWNLRGNHWFLQMMMFGEKALATYIQAKQIVKTTTVETDDSNGTWIGYYSKPTNFQRPTSNLDFMLDYFPPSPYEIKIESESRRPQELIREKISKREQPNDSGEADLLQLSEPVDGQNFVS